MHGRASGRGEHATEGQLVDLGCAFGLAGGIRANQNIQFSLDDISDISICYASLTNVMYDYFSCFRIDLIYNSIITNSEAIKPLGTGYSY
jgi:hypothetical protein